MLDALPDFSIEIGADLFVKLFENASRGFKGWVIDKAREKDIFGFAAKEYAKRLYDRYNEIRVFGMQEPIPLKNLFVRVKILEKLSIKNKASYEELISNIDFHARSFGKAKQTLPAHRAVNKYQKFIVLGKPGAGKTTFLKYLTLLSLTPDTSLLKEQKIPIFIGLKQFGDSGSTLLDFIVSQFDICGFPDAQAFIQRLLEKGNFRIFLDGLDEVTQDQTDAVVQDILDFTDKYSKNQFIISCRVAAYNHWFTAYADIEIADFQEDQMELFITHWFRKEPDIGEACWKKLRADPQLKELATIPLLLTLLCIAYDEDNDFSSNKSELYENAVHALLKKWDSSRRITRAAIYKNLSPKRKLDMFCKIAAKSFQAEQYILPKRHLEKEIENYICNLDASKATELTQDSEAVLSAIESQHAIFTQRAKGFYSFSHLTLQEYFTAKYIVDNNQLSNLVSAHLEKDRWKEVFLLTTGLLSNADPLLQMMLTALRGYTQKTFLRQLFLEIEKSLHKAKLQPTQANYFYFLGLALAIARSSADQKNFHLLTALDAALLKAHALAPDRDLSPQHSLDQDLDRARDRALALRVDLDRKVFYFKADQLDDLISYLKITALLIACLRVEGYLSKSLREEVMRGLVPGVSS